MRQARCDYWLNIKLNIWDNKIIVNHLLTKTQLNCDKLIDICIISDKKNISWFLWGELLAAVETNTINLSQRLLSIKLMTTNNCLINMTTVTIYDLTPICRKARTKKDILHKLFHLLTWNQVLRHTTRGNLKVAVEVIHCSIKLK